MAREQPAQTYFPRARVRLIVRFEEFGRVTSTPKPPKKPPHLRKGKGVDNKEGGLSVVKQGAAFLLRAPSQKQGNPTTLATSSADQRTFVIEGVLPARFGINRNGIRTADTCSIEINYRDLPIDPRVVRACGVQVYLGTITQEQYERETLGGPQGAPMIETDWIDSAGRKRSNLRFEGWVDEWRVSHPKGAISTVSLECTDNTRILIEQDAPPKLVVAADKPLDQAVADYLANFPQFRGFRVEHQPPGAAVPQLDKALGKLATKKKGGPPPAGGAGAGGGGTAKLAVWDYLTDIAGSLGLIVRLEGVTIIFQRARTLYGSAFSGRPEDPFSGRILPSGRQINSRLFVYGRNIDDLDFGRKITRFAAFNVEVRCFDPAQGRTLIARFPTKEDRQARLLPGDSADEKWTVHTVSGVSDEATLRAIAQGIYEGVGRQELGVKFATKSLGSFGGGNLDPDALDVQAGDAIDVEIARVIPQVDEQASTVGAIENNLAEKAANYMRSQGFDDAFARAYGQALAQVGFPTTFRVKTLAINWDYSEGVSFDFEGVNYVEVRREKSLPNGEDVKPADQAGATPVKVVVDDSAPGDPSPPTDGFA